MSHVAPEPPSRRRLDRIIGSALALIGVLVLVVAVVALRNPDGRQASKAAASISTASSARPSRPPTARPSSRPPVTTPSPTPPSTPPGTPPQSATSAHPIPLVVLNSTSQTGLAETARARFVAGGWTVISVGNLVNDILSTCAYYDPSDPANQQQAEALQQQFPAIKRVKEKFDGLPAGPIVVVLTSDYS